MWLKSPSRGGKGIPVLLLLQSPTQTYLIHLLFIPQDALTNLVKRSQIHFVHCLVPRVGAEGKPSQPCVTGEVGLTLDVPTLRVQLSGAQLLDALRLYRIGMASLRCAIVFKHVFVPPSLSRCPPKQFKFAVTNTWRAAKLLTPPD